MTTLHQIDGDGSPEPPPRLCRNGLLFADALRRALSRASADKAFRWITLSDSSDERLWVQLADSCVNVTDALPRATQEYVATEPVLECVSRTEGMFSTFTFDLPPSIELVASTVCNYMQSMFPDSMAAVDWVELDL